MTQVLVTGGGGFLGGALCRALRARGVEVVAMQRRPAPALEALGVRVVCGDIADAQAVLRAAEGCQAVFHVAAKAGHWGSYDSYFRPNVLGTRNVIAACRALGIGQLIHTSTPSVTHAAKDVEGGDESLPYAKRPRAHYPATKIIAEREVLAANGPQLATVALRPRLIWGPGDNHLLPNLLARARAGRLRFVGGGGNLVDTTYIDNAVDAQLLAWQQLKPGSACAGKAYFISNGEPWPLERIVNGLLAAAGESPVERSLPYPLAWGLGALMEAAWTLLPLPGEPLMTRFLAEQLATSHWYRLDAAARDFGYRPRLSNEEGLRRLAQALRGS